MNYVGILTGAATFLIIGLSHPVVIWVEYHFGTRCWWAFLLFGLGAVLASLLVGSTILSVLLGVLGFCSLWGIHELFQQRKRVERGWFPRKKQ